MTCLFVTVLLAVVGALLSVPLLPALYELRQRQDAEPLNVIQQHAGDIRHFANSFAAVIKELEPVLERSHVSGDFSRGILPDGSHYFILPHVDELPKVKEQSGLLSCPYVIAFSGDVTCPRQMNFAKEIYVRGHFWGGDRNQYRAVLARSDVRFGRQSTVLRWAHAGSQLVADEECKLYGRISAECRIELRRGCRFVRLNAPRIDIGQRDEKDTLDRAISKSGFPVQTRRLLHDGEFTIHAGEVIDANIVTRGKLHVCSGAHVIGSIKSNRDLIIENEAIIDGSVICAERIIVGSRCRLHGPIIAERSMVLYDGTVCGEMHTPTTVSSPEIQIQEGVVIFGTLWARQSGSVWRRA